MDNKTRMISFRVTDKEYANIVAASGGNVSRFMKTCLREYILGFKAGEGLVSLDTGEKQEVLRKAGEIVNNFDAAILQRMTRDKDFLLKLDDKTFIDIVKQRMPKFSGIDSDLEGDLFSLGKFVGGLPGTVDLSEKLNETRLELYKATHERDLAREMLSERFDSEERRAFAERVYSFAVGYAMQLLVRRRLPGLGDADGLDDAGMLGVREAVERMMSEVEL